MCLGQIGVELYGFASQLIGPVKGVRAQIVVIQRDGPGYKMGPAKPGVGARVVGVDREGMLQKATHLVKLGRLP
jgi:hypothetical protein